MIVKSLTGKVLFYSTDKTLKSTIEAAVQEGVDLSYANLRSAKLKGAALDGLKAQGACFWGADLTGADVGLADLRACDLRAVEMKNTCLAETNLSGADLRGAYFEGCLLEGAVFDDVRLSCPSFWNCGLQNLKSFKGLIYVHEGDVEIPIKSNPLVIHGLNQNLVLLEEYFLWGRELHRACSFKTDLQQGLFNARVLLDRGIKGSHLRNATHPNPKNLSRDRFF